MTAPLETILECFPCTDDDQPNNLPDRHPTVDELRAATAELKALRARITELEKACQ